MAKRWYEKNYLGLMFVRPRLAWVEPLLKRGPGGAFSQIGGKRAFFGWPKDILEGGE